MANWMQNVVNNIQTSQNKASDFLNKIITDEKTEYIDHKTAIVPGVYAGNHVYRKETLKHIWGVYNMLPDVLTQSMGKLFEIATESMLPPKNMKNLLDYTHDGASVYSTNIREKYINLPDKKVETISSASKSSYMPWYFTDDDNLVGSSYSDYWGMGTPSNVFENRRTAKEIERDARKAEKKAKKDARRQIREERQEERINRIEKKNSERAERVEKRINKRKKSKNKPNEPTNKLNFYDGSYKDMYYEDFLYDTYVDFVEDKNGDIKDVEEKVPSNYVLRSRLLKKSSELFDKGKIHYYSDIKGNLLEKTGGYVDSLGGGEDRGRGKSLKNRKGEFFRSWSHAKQYVTLNNIMRNKNTKKQIDLAIENKVKTQPNRDVLNKNTVLQSNGLIKISPTTEDNDNGLYANLKKCMFSIENLALLDAHHVHYKETDKEGVEHNYYRDMKAKRIMWFPPYDLKFSDNSNVQWSETNFIGRGEPIYTYTNTRRTGTLSFTMLIDHPSIIHNFKDGHFNDSKLLKFFNGDVKEEDFVEKTFNVSADRYEVKEKNNAESEPKETVNTDGPYSCFSVYFPYWYSGMSSNKGLDTDVMLWLYEGVGTKTIEKEDADFWGITKRGYEMDKKDDKTGISSISYNSDSIKLTKIVPCNTVDDVKPLHNNPRVNLGKGWNKGVELLDRTFNITFKKNGVEEKVISISAAYFDKYFTYNFLAFKVKEGSEDLDITYEGDEVIIKVKYYFKEVKQGTVTLTKNDILNMYFKEKYSLFKIPIIRNKKINGETDKNYYNNPDEFFRCFNRLDESGKDKNKDKGEELNYTDSTERNSSCEASEEGVEKLSFKEVYELLNNK